MCVCVSVCVHVCVLVCVCVCVLVLTNASASVPLDPPRRRAFSIFGSVASSAAQSLRFASSPCR